MAESEIQFLSVQEALKLVAAIQEEENIHEQNRRILTVYDHENRELCWFDFEEVVEAVGPGDKAQQREAVENYIIHHIPAWVLDL
jgi:hypothetical protein